jgi:mRNA-degrading endonuclease RelE of RelBE toxin-antitoxin system
LAQELKAHCVRRKAFADIEKLKEDVRPHGKNVLSTLAALETKEKFYRIYAGPGKNYRVVYQIRDEALLVLNAL